MDLQRLKSMNDDARQKIREYVREYAQSSLKEVRLDIQKPLPYEAPPPPPNQNIGLNVVGPGGAPLQVTSDMGVVMTAVSDALNIDAGMLNVGDTIVVDSSELTLSYLFDTLIYVFVGGVKLPKNSIDKQGEFYVVNETLWFKEDYAIDLAGEGHPDYQKSLVNVLSCPFNELAVYLVDEQKGIRELAKMRHTWKVLETN